MKYSFVGSLAAVYFVFLLHCFAVRSSARQLLLRGSELQGAPNGKRLALIFKGESFRSKKPPPEGISGERAQVGAHKRATCEGRDDFKEQLQLAEGHAAFFSEVEKFGFTVDVFGVTYNCSNGQPFASQLPRMYGERMKFFKVIPERDTNQQTSIVTGLSMVAKYQQDASKTSWKPPPNYDYYVLLRWDYTYSTVYPCFQQVFDGYPRDMQWMSPNRLNEDAFISIPSAHLDLFLNFTRTYEAGSMSGCCPADCPTSCNYCVQNFIRFCGDQDSGFYSGTNPRPTSLACKYTSYDAREDLPLHVITNNETVPDYLSYDQGCIDRVFGGK